MQTVLVGTASSVSPGDNVLLVQLLLKASSEKALSLGYSSVMMTTSHTLGKVKINQFNFSNYLEFCTQLLTDTLYMTATVWPATEIQYTQGVSNQ